MARQANYLALAPRTATSASPGTAPSGTESSTMRIPLARVPAGSAIATDLPAASADPFSTVFHVTRSSAPRSESRTHTSRCPRNRTVAALMSYTPSKIALPPLRPGRIRRRGPVRRIITVRRQLRLVPLCHAARIRGPVERNVRHLVRRRLLPPNKAPQYGAGRNSGDLPATYTGAPLEHTHDQTCLRQRRLNASYPNRLGYRALMGYSMGALESLFVAATGPTNQPPLLKFDRYVAINTPVRMLHGVSKLDEFYRAPLDWPQAERTGDIENTFLKVAA